jgi:hypothetical protein
LKIPSRDKAERIIQLTFDYVSQPRCIPSGLLAAPSVFHGSSQSTSSRQQSAVSTALSPSKPLDAVSITQARSFVQTFGGRQSASRSATSYQRRLITITVRPCNLTSPDVNTLLGNDTRIQLSNVVVKWITYCLVLHNVALVLAAGSGVFGLLAHIQEIAICSDPLLPSTFTTPPPLAPPRHRIKPQRCVLGYFWLIRYTVKL